MSTDKTLLKNLNEPSCVGGVSRCFDPHPFGAKNPFDFELEMINIFGKEKAKKVIDEIAEFYKTSLPIQPVGISFSPFGFDEFGKSLTATSNCCHPYRYLVTLKRKKILENDETFYYRFN